MVDNRPMRIASLLALFLIAIMPSRAVAQHAAVEASGAWIRIAPPGAMMLAGYVTLTNSGDAVAELESVHSAAFGSVEVHRTEVVDGVSRMRAVPELRIAPGETRSEAHTSELQSLMRNSYAVFCLKKKTTRKK